LTTVDVEVDDDVYVDLDVNQHYSHARVSTAKE
jgi:hypothetical protein